MSLRWCVCAAQRDIPCPLRITLLTHAREHTRPSSTGNLVKRVFPGARQHVWRNEQPPLAADVLMPGCDVWILHPDGGPVPAAADPAAVQVLLLDGMWNETRAMTRAVASWGKLVSLPLTGESRFWLRAQQDGGRFCTAEALLFVLDLLGLAEAHSALQVQFELLVYASLRARGYKGAAEEFLQDSVIRKALPDFLEQFHTRRPRSVTG
jgi:hypothetical protein